MKRCRAGDQIELTLDRRIRKSCGDHGESRIGQSALGKCDQRWVRFDSDKFAWIAFQQGLGDETATGSNLKDGGTGRQFREELVIQRIGVCKTPLVVPRGIQTERYSSDFTTEKCLVSFRQCTAPFFARL